jgi:hypothetical protein
MAITARAANYAVKEMKKRIFKEEQGTRDKMAKTKQEKKANTI